MRGNRGGPARNSDEGPVMGAGAKGPGKPGRPDANPAGDELMDGPKRKVKSFEIPKRLVYEAWEKVRDNAGAPGVDAVSINRVPEQTRGQTSTSSGTG